jgi:hypothetical protein
MLNKRVSPAVEPRAGEKKKPRAGPWLNARSLKGVSLDKMRQEGGGLHLVRETVALLEALLPAADTSPVRQTLGARPGAFLGQTFASVSVFLDFLAHLAGERQAAGDPEPVAVVLDELPYLAAAKHLPL